MAWTAEWCEVQSSPGWYFSKEGEAFMGTSPQSLPGLRNWLLCPQPPLPHPIPDLSNYIVLCKSRSHLLPVGPTLSGTLSSSQQTRASIKSVFVYWGKLCLKWVEVSTLPTVLPHLTLPSIPESGGVNRNTGKENIFYQRLDSVPGKQHVSTMWCSRQFRTMACNMIYMSPLVYRLNRPLFHFIFW